MEKRLYISPKTTIEPLILETNVMAPSEHGQIGGGDILTKEREGDELIEEESAKMTNEYSLW